LSMKSSWPACSAPRLPKTTRIAENTRCMMRHSQRAPALPRIADAASLPELCGPAKVYCMHCIHPIDRPRVPSAVAPGCATTRAFTIAPCAGSRRRAGRRSGRSRTG
jgi:hypothetical protein